MVARTPQARAGGLALWLLLGGVLAGLAVLLQHPGDRGLGLVLALAGLALGMALSPRLPARAARRTVMERLNDSAFMVVLATASLLLVGVARPYGVLVPALVGGLVAGRPLRRERQPTP